MSADVRARLQDLEQMRLLLVRCLSLTWSTDPAAAELGQVLEEALALSESIGRLKQQL